MTNNSIAIYTDQSSSDISINYNIWTDFGVNNFLDISVNIDNATSTSKITVFLPFFINDNELIDLSPFYKSETITTGIYNCPLSVKEFKDGEYIAVSFNQEDPRAFIQLSANNYSMTNPDDSSTIIEFQLITPKSFNKVTFVFRIPFKSLTSQIKKILASKRNWLDAIATPIIQRTLPFDFRVNEVRSLPNSIVRVAHLEPFKEERFFINVPNDIEVDRLNSVRVRNLETDIFEEYFPSKCYEKGGLCYGWIKRPTSSSVLSTILIYRKWSIYSICLYLLIISLINIISGIIVNLLFM